MKNIFTFLLGGLLTTSAFANNITLTLPDNRSYQVMIDGRNVSGYSYTGNTIYLNDLQYGQHTIEIYRLKRNGFWGNRNNIMYSSSFNSSPEYDLNITIDHSGRAQMYQSRNKDYDRNGHGNSRSRYDNSNDRWSRHRNYNGDDNDRDYGRDGDYDNGDYNHGGYGNGDWDNRYGQGMSDYDFNQLIQSIRNQRINKLSAAKEAVHTNYFSTYQVRRILQIFPSENDRLELARLSYRNIVDRQNFRQLYDLFSYSSQSELDRYTGDFRH